MCWPARLWPSCWSSWPSARRYTRSGSTLPGSCPVCGQLPGSCSGPGPGGWVREDDPAERVALRAGPARPGERASGIARAGLGVIVGAWVSNVLIAAGGRRGRCRALRRPRADSRCEGARAWYGIGSSMIVRPAQAPVAKTRWRSVSTKDHSSSTRRWRAGSGSRPARATVSGHRRSNVSHIGRAVRMLSAARVRGAAARARPPRMPYVDVVDDEAADKPGHADIDQPRVRDRDWRRSWSRKFAPVKSASVKLAPRNAPGRS